MSKRLVRRRGSVLILVVALLAVLFVTGMGFLSMTSIDRLSSKAAERNAALAIEADSVVDRIISELSRDLWGDDGRMLSGQGANEEWDYPCSNNVGSGANFGTDDDAWLACILPEMDSSGEYVWRHISNLSGVAGFGRNASDTNVPADVLEADTDMDGYGDARWILSPTGRYRYAIRVIDLNSMLNLNTGGRGFPDDPGNTPYHVAIGYSNIEPDWNSYARGDVQMVCDTYGRGAPLGYDQDNNGHADWLDRIENNGREDNYHGTDIAFHLDDPFIRASGKFPVAHPYRASETVALLSYGIKPGPVAARITVGWPNTFSSDRNKMPDIRTNPANPAATRWSYNMYYTTYGWTRNIRSRVLPSGAAPSAGGISDWAGWQALLDAYDSSGLGKVYVNHKVPHDPVFTRALVAAMVLSGAMQGNGGMTQPQIEQLVVNLVDFRDSDADISKVGANPDGDPHLVDTVFNAPAAPIYGYEAQTFVTEIGAYLNSKDPSENCYAIEFFNPYKATINMAGWQVRSTAGGTVTIPGSWAGGGRPLVGSGRRMIIRNVATRPGGGAWGVSGRSTLDDPGLDFGVGGTGDIRVLRPQNADGTGDMVVVDQVSMANVKAPTALPDWLDSGKNGGQYVARGDREWMMARDVWKKVSLPTWNRDNGPLDPLDPVDPVKRLDPNQDRFYLQHRNGLEAALVAPARGADFDTLGQLHWLLLIGPEEANGTPMTARITAAGTWQATDDLFVNFANKTRGDVRLLTNLVRLDRRYNNRDDNGDGEVDSLAELRMAGLININTATPHVLRCLNYYLCPSEASWNSETGDGWETLSRAKLPYEYFDFNQRIYDYRESSSGKDRGFRKGPAEIMNVTKMIQTDNLFDQLVFPKTIPGIYGNQGTYRDSIRNMRAELAHFYSLLPTLDTYGNPVVNPWFYDQATFNDLNERMFLFDRISDLITTRSDTFLAYILVQRIDHPSNVDYWSNQNVRVIQQRRMVVVFDRSRCNYRLGSLQYVAPEVVGRSVTTW